MSDGWNVIRCARRLEPDAGSNWRLYDLSEPLRDDFLADIDVVVHAAYIDLKQQANSYSVNVLGANRLIAAARKAAARFVFISSLSASPTARSQYGRQKFAIEGLVDPERDLIVRPGLVLGSGGIFGRFLRHVQSGRPIPLIDGGKQPMQTIYIDDLIGAVRALLSVEATGSVILAEAPAVTYAEFFRALAVRAGAKTHFIRLPSWLLLAFTDIALAMRVPSPIERDNVLGLLDMRFVDPAMSGALQLPRIRNFDESLQALFQGTIPSARG